MDNIWVKLAILFLVLQGHPIAITQPELFYFGIQLHQGNINGRIHIAEIFSDLERSCHNKRSIMPK